MVSKQTVIREATHYNSWYYGPPDTLSKELESYLEKADSLDNTKFKVKGFITPHAGIMWSGPTAAWGFKNLLKRDFKRVFILGPSHFVEFPGCGLSTADYFQTPFCDLKVDREVFSELKKHNKEKQELFFDLDIQIDEYEHSIEVQTPYLGYFLKDRKDVTIVPIVTGKLSYEEELLYAKILAEYYSSDDNIFVIAEDFCHWGKRHKFFWQDTSQFKKIHESIEFLDNMAFDLIQKKSSKDFKEYLLKWKNNLCGGGSPVTIYLAVIEKFLSQNKKEEKSNEMKLVHYTKSNPKIDSDKEEAVSYAVLLDYYSV